MRQPGTQACVQGQWGSCDGQVLPSDEACNGVDDDCDGVADEGCDLDAGAEGAAGADAGDGEAQDGLAEGGEPVFDAGDGAVSTDESGQASTRRMGLGASLGVLFGVLFLSRRRRALG